MITLWKQTKTSFEGAIKDEGSGGRSKAKKKGLNGAKSAADTDVIDIGDRHNSSSASSKKKRRKQGGGGYADAASMDVEPVICLTSQHRVAVLGKAKDGNLIESKSRTSLSARASEDAFAGMPRSGAKYDPRSNMIYAIRNNGTEVAVWTAAPSSVISGPDDKVDSSRVNGKKLDEAGANQNMKKRKADQHDVDASRLSANAIISQRLQLPKGKVALTLTPFSTTSSTANGKKPQALVGASGCCEDGSIWIAIRSVNETSSGGPYMLTIVDGSSFTQNEANSSRRSGKSRTGNGEWKVLDSRATCAIESQGRKGPNNGGVILRLHSVLYSEESGRLAYHQQHASISSKDGDWSISKVKKSTLTDLLQLSQTKRDVAAILDASGCSVTIVHRSDGEGWMLTSANVSQSVNTPTTPTFPLNCSNDESVFSFGNVFNNISAILTRGNGTMTLKLVDFQRRAEISSKCLAMFTNEMNGFIALLASSEEPGSVELLHTNVDTGSNSQSTPVAKGTKDFTETLPTHEANASFGIVVCGDTFSKDANSKSIDTIVDEACTLLVSAANSLIDGDQEEEAHPANGCEMITDARRGEECKPIKNGIKAHSSAESSQLPKTFIDVAFRESARLLLSSKKELRKDVLPVLVSVLGTQLVSAREDYGIEAHREHVLLHILKCAEDGNIGKLDLVDAVLNNVRDIPEALLVSILRFVLRNVDAEDAVAHYEKSPDHSKLSKQSARDASNGKASTRLLSQIMLDYTSKILLKSGNMHVEDDCSYDRISLSLGTVDWIAAVTDAHMGTVVKITSEGGLVLGKMQRVIRSVMSQSEFANELKELADHSASVASSLAEAAAKSNKQQSPILVTP
ncbi:hypothetical protein QTG54_000977 [Skeletonema marinoi]|uniref:Uncharacterized protein n=1 Tax=Skeletonema marinoi TaxID=267567 RepID=A0AAD9DKT2_9STRA|nr:hypothetical protein QTG54_000977 [Skeletonema marinoi]